MRFDIVTLFPELFINFLQISFVGRAVQQQQISTRFQSPRDFGMGKHRAVDDTPYGGGSGMVMRVDCLVESFEALDQQAVDLNQPKAHRVLLTPQGQCFHQNIAARLSKLPAIMLICGRYEGFDERVRSYVDEEISLGDFVITGGELAAMVILEAVVRLIPNVLGNALSTHEESHSPISGGWLEYPQYTRPLEFRGASVPEILMSGHHANIQKWRQEQMRIKTQERRPDLIPKLSTTKE